MALPPIQSFPATPYADYPRDPALDAAVKRIGLLPQFNRLGIGLVDLSSPLDGLPYGGSNDERNFFIASTAKLVPMYAACQLLRAVTDAVRGVVRSPGVTGAEIIALASAQLQTLPWSAYWNRFPKDRPNIPQILSVVPDPNGPGWQAWFASTEKPWPPVSNPVEAPLGAVRPLKFWERLQLMVGASNDCAAMTCIQDIGFQYINGLLDKAGFFDPQTNVGLWLGAAYSTQCNNTSSKWAQVPGPGRFPNDTGFQVGSAKALAKLLTLIYQGKLVSIFLSLIMGGLMSKQFGSPGSSTRSFFLEALQQTPPVGAPLAGLSAFSKLGMAPSANSDAAIIERDLRPGTSIRYVAVGLGEPGNLNGQLLGQLILQLDACIAGRH